MYVIAKNRAYDQFFTSHSSYDKPEWTKLNEATKYRSYESAERAMKTLAKYGSYEARIRPLSEMMSFEMPDEEQQVAPMDDVSVPIDDQTSPDEMTAGEVGELCGDCEHEPCTCDDGEVEVNNFVDDEVLNDEDVVDDPDAEEVAPDDSTLDNPVFRESAQTFQIKDIPVLTSGNASVADSHETSLKTPSSVMSELKAAITKHKRNTETTFQRDQDSAAFAKTVVAALEELQTHLQKGTVEGLKKAQIAFTSFMNPITALVPAPVSQFITSGGKVTSLKDMFASFKESYTLAKAKLLAEKRIQLAEVRKALVRARSNIMEGEEQRLQDEIAALEKDVPASMQTQPSMDFSEDPDISVTDQETDEFDDDDASDAHEQLFIDDPKYREHFTRAEDIEQRIEKLNAEIERAMDDANRTLVRQLTKQLDDLEEDLHYHGAIAGQMLEKFKASQR